MGLRRFVEQENTKVILEVYRLFRIQKGLHTGEELFASPPGQVVAAFLCSTASGAGFEDQPLPPEFVEGVVK